MDSNPERKDNSGSFWFPYGFLKSALLISLLITGVYLLLVFIVDGKGLLPSSTALSLIGLFVPYGYWNTLCSFANIAVCEKDVLTEITTILFFVFVVAIFFFDRFAYRLGLSSRTKHFTLLMFLFLWTMLVDFLVWGGWQSFEMVKEIFFTGTPIDF